MIWDTIGIWMKLSLIRVIYLGLYRKVHHLIEVWQTPHLITRYSKNWKGFSWVMISHHLIKMSLDILIRILQKRKQEEAHNLTWVNFIITETKAAIHRALHWDKNSLKDNYKLTLMISIPRLANKLTTHKYYLNIRKE